MCCDWRRRERGSPADVQALSEEVTRRIRAADPRQSVILATPSWPSDGLLDRCWRGLLPENGSDRAIKAALRKPLTAAKFLTGDYSQPLRPG